MTSSDVDITNSRDRTSSDGSESEVTAATLAYLSPHFLDSDDARPLRILAEYLAPLGAFMRAGVKDTVVFFGSARISETGHLGRYYTEARELAAQVTRWSCQLFPDGSRLVVCSGGGGGIMEAANRGAKDAGGRTIGLNIGLPHEQRPNRFLDPDLAFEFHYFFMRKLWFAHLARAVIVFPGGFGTIDEMFELLTLRQTRKLDRDICIMLYGSEYWHEVINFPALARQNVIDAADLELMHVVDSPAQALACLQQHVRLEPERSCPAIAKSVFSRSQP
jgi:uncharacterized protein (TIGR00730 family)